MSGIYSTRFITVHGGQSGQYTVPAGYLAVVRNVLVCNTGSGTEAFNLGNYTTGHTLIVGFVSPNTAASLDKATLSFDMRYVAKAGELLAVSMGADVNMSVSGYLFVA